MRVTSRAPAAVVLALLLYHPAPSAGAEDPRVIPGGREAEIVALAKPIELGGAVAAGYRLDGIRVDGQTFAFVLGGEGLPTGRAALRAARGGAARSARWSRPRRRSMPTAWRPWAPARHVAPRVDGALWERLLVVPSATPRRRLPAASPSTVGRRRSLRFSRRVSRVARWRRARWGALPIAIAPIAVWYLQWGAAPAGLDVGQLEAWLQERERHLVQLALAVALAALATALIAALRRMRRSGFDLRSGSTLASFSPGASSYASG